MTDILFIEDELDILENMIEILELSGMSLTGVSTGNDAINKLDQEKFGLIFCDINLPDITGYEILDHFKSSPNYNDTSFVFLSASAQAKDVEQGKLSGADGYLKKPCSANKIINVAKQYLGKSSQ